MSSYLALWNLTGEPADLETVNSMLAAAVYKNSDGQASWLAGNVALTHKHFWIMPEEQHQPQPLVHQASGCVIACSARLDNRGELIDALDLPGHAIQYPDAELLLQAYLCWGINCAEHLLGDFVFTIWNAKEHILFSARDAMGCEDLFYYIDDKICLLATSISMLLNHPAITQVLNEKRVAEYLSAINGDDRETFFQSIYHLPPGHSLEVSESGMSLWRYWEIDSSNVIHKPDPRTVAAQYRQLIKEAVSSRLRTTYSAGISLSGGLDSSSLAMMAAEYLAETGTRQPTFNSYSYVFTDYPKCDESQDILTIVEKASQKFPLKPYYFNGDKSWPAPHNEDWLVCREFPYQDPYFYLLKGLLQKASEDNIRSLLSGFYGDDLYAGDNYWLVDMMLENRLHDALVDLKRFSKWVNIKRDVWDYGFKAVIPSSVKSVFKKVKGDEPAWKRILAPKFAEVTGLQEQANGKPKEYANRSLGKLRRYEALFLSGYGESIGIFQSLARPYSIQYSFPFMDRRIIEFLFSLPTDIIGLPFCSRRILRDAMRNDLPDSIRLFERKSSMVELFNYGIFHQNSYQIQKHLIKSQLVDRNYIQSEWIDSCYTTEPTIERSQLLWNSLTLAVWLEKYWQ